MNNQDIFHVLSSQILVVLSDEFPAPIFLNRNTFIEPLVNRQELWDLETKSSNAEFFLSIQQQLDADGLSQKDNEKVKTDINELKLKIKEKRQSISNIEAVWNGTLLFLEAEGFIREFEGNGYQLTAKGFVHLNQKINEDQTSLRSKLREAVSPKNLVTTLANSGLEKLFTMILGG